MLDFTLSIFGRGPADKATYQISKTWAFWFQTGRFLKVFPIWFYVKHVNPGAGPFLPQGYNFNNFGISLLGKAAYQISKTWVF